MGPSLPDGPGKTMRQFRPGDFSPRAFFRAHCCLARLHNWRIVGSQEGMAGRDPLPFGTDVRRGLHIATIGFSRSGAAMAGVLPMKRIRLAAAVAAFGAGLIAGCTSFGNGPIMSRLRGNHPGDCPCEEAGGQCCEGPALGGEGFVPGPTLPPTGQPAVPALTPAPTILPDPARALPAAPSSRTK